MAAVLATTATAVLALVAQDGTPLRASPGAAAAVHAQLPAGELVELRGTRLDHLQVYAHRLERGGYVRASQLRPIALTEAEAPQLLAVLRFLRDTPGSESLGIAYAAAYLRAAPAAAIDGEAFDALGTMAERLARRAGSRGAPASVGAQLDVVAPYGVRFASYERDGSVTLCYDGEAFRQVLALGPARTTAAQRARAVLGLTRHDCIDPALRTDQREAFDQSRAALLDTLPAATTAGLDALTQNRLRNRTASVWAVIAFERGRRGQGAEAAAQRAIDALAGVDKSELDDDESAAYQEAAIRVGAVRGAAAAATAPSGRWQLQTAPGAEAGQTCVRVVDTQTASRSGAAVMAERCTYAVVWPGSVRASADGRAIALAVQPLEGWSELWVWRAGADGTWRVDVLPPSAGGPGLGYAEFAGWTPGATRKLLLARESKLDGKLARRFEVLDAQTLDTEKSASTPQLLAAFGQWADAGWRRGSVSVR